MQKLLYAILFCAAAAQAQKHQTSVKQSTPGKKIHDTIFISREVTKDDYCAVYIEQNRKSEQYDWVLNFKMDQYDNESYQQNYQALKRQFKNPLKTFDLSGLPKEWVPLYRYKGRYYIYSPSEPGQVGKQRITDSTIIDWGFEIHQRAISMLKKTNGHTWYLETNAPDLDKDASRSIIHIIDPKNKIAIWEYPSEPPAHRYELFVPRQYARNFDMIVNFCRESKTAEFMFDNVDYLSLLKGK